MLFVSGVRRRAACAEETIPGDRMCADKGLGRPRLGLSRWSCRMGERGIGGGVRIWADLGRRSYMLRDESVERYDRDADGETGAVRWRPDTGIEGKY